MLKQRSSIGITIVFCCVTYPGTVYVMGNATLKVSQRRQQQLLQGGGATEKPTDCSYCFCWIVRMFGGWITNYNTHLPTNRMLFISFCLKLLPWIYHPMGSKPSKNHSTNETSKLGNHPVSPLQDWNIWVWKRCGFLPKPGSNSKYSPEHRLSRKEIQLSGRPSFRGRLTFRGS